MRNTYIAILLLLPLLTVVSCVERFEPDLPDSEEEVLVVEGNIESGAHSILYLSLSCGLHNPEKKPVENAKITLRGSDGTTVKGKKYEILDGIFDTRVMNNGSVENGKYCIFNTPQLKSDVEYWIEMQVGIYTYESEHQKPLDAPEIDSLRYRQVRNDKKVEILVSTVPSSNEDEMVYTSWDFLEAWEIHTPNWTEWEWDADFQGGIWRKLDKCQYTNVGWKTQLSQSPITLCTKGHVQNETIHLIDYTDDRLQTCYFIRVQNCAISRAEHEYYATRDKMANGIGGLFSPMPTELPSNIRCTNASKRAEGFVGIRGKVNQAEIHFLNKEVEYENTHKKVSPPEEALKGKSPAQLWKEGYRILFYDPNDHTVRWTYGWWVDCRVAPWFASLQKPDFWHGSWTDGEE